MKTACLAAFASLRGALLFAVLASLAGAQNQTWIRQFGTPEYDAVHASAPDGIGGVYVTGSTRGSLAGQSAGDYDAWLAHYDGAGNQTWTLQLGTASDDRVFAAAPDGAGGVFVSGSTLGSLGGPNVGIWDAWLAHYDSAGNQTWIRQFGTTESDLVSASASDGAGGVYVSGYTWGSFAGPSAGSRDAWLVHFDGAGNQSWIRQFGTSSTDRADATAPDGAGGVYVSGYTSGSLAGPNAGAFDAWLAHYDGAGNQTWIRQLGTTHDDYAFAAAPDGAGGVFVSGITLGSLGGPNAGAGDAWIAHYDGAGNQTWIRQFGTAALDWISASSPDGAGGVLTSGSSTPPPSGPIDVWLVHHDGAGNQVWSRQFGTSNNDGVIASAPDGSGGVYVSGFTQGSLGGAHAGGNDAWLAHYDGLVATRYCAPAVPNSTGQPGVLTATGSKNVVANDLTIEATQLPANSFGFFLTSRSQGLIVGLGGSQGDLCLSGAIGRYVGPGQTQNTGAAGTFDLVLDLTMVPTPTGFVAIQPGDTWNFQAWHRDANPGSTSNFTDAVSVTFL